MTTVSVKHGGLLTVLCVLFVCVLCPLCVRTCACVHLVHVSCSQDVSKQLEGLAKHLRASGKRPDSPRTQLELIGSSQAVLLVGKHVFTLLAG